MKRVSIAEIMQETGLSRATVDRVLNARGRVHPRTREAVEETMRRLRAPEPGDASAPFEVDMLLRVGRAMMNQMRAAWDQIAMGAFHDMYQSAQPDVVKAATRLCEDVSRPLIIAAKNTPDLVDVLRIARQRGKAVISVISDLAPDARDLHVGIDDRAAGRTAAYLIGRLLRERSSTVGVVVGHTAFRCHEDREIGFRTGLRAYFPDASVSGEAQGDDHAGLTRDAVARLLKAQPSISALYNVGGGNLGVAEACGAAGRPILFVAHEVNAVTTPLLRDGAMDFAIAADPGLVLKAALARLDGGRLKPGPDHVLIDFSVFTRFNLPGFAASGVADPSAGTRT